MRVGHDLDALEVRRRVARELVGGEGTGIGRGRGDERVSERGQLGEHGVDILVLEDGGDDDVPLRAQRLGEPARTGGIMGAVADLAGPALEAAGQADLGPGGNGMPDERFGGYPRAADEGGVPGDEVNVSVVR